MGTPACKPPTWVETSMAWQQGWREAGGLILEGLCSIPTVMRRISPLGEELPGRKLHLSHLGILPMAYQEKASGIIISYPLHSLSSACMHKTCLPLHLPGVGEVGNLWSALPSHKKPPLLLIRRLFVFMHFAWHAFCLATSGQERRKEESHETYLKSLIKTFSFWEVVGMSPYLHL